MAIWNTPLYTSQVPQAGQSQAVGYQLAKASRGALRIAECLYVISAGATEAANDLIYLSLQYQGERLIPSYSRVVFQNPGTTLTLEVGDSVTANRYTGTLTLSNTASALNFDSSPGASSGAATYNPADITVPAYSAANPPQNIPPPTTVDQTIIIAKILSAGTLTAGAKILFLLGFVAN
jgi:hypothetical protein